MALTKDQIISRLARQLVDDKVAGLTWAQLVAAVQALTTEQKAALVAAAQARSPQRIGEMMNDAVRTWAAGQAQADATAMLAGDVLALADLEKILRA